MSDPLAIPAAGRVRRAAGVLATAVGDGILLVDPVVVRAHGLNVTAASIWAALPDATVDDRWVVADDVVADVAGSFSLEVDAVRDGVLDTLDRFVAEGLLERDGVDDEPRPVPDHLPGQFTNVPFTDEVVPPAVRARPWTSNHGPFRGLDVTFDLVTDSDEIGRYLAETWAPLAVDPDPTGTTEVRHYAIVGSDSDPTIEHLLALDDRVVARSGAASTAVALAVWHANQLVSTETDRFLQLHAAAVTIDGGAVLLPAEMNSGKSTLAVGLVADGAGYLTDETVAVDPATGLVHPYAKAISLDPGSWPLFPHLEPRIQQALPRLAHRKWYVDPEAIRADAASGPAPPVAIVFPTYDPDHPTALERLAPIQAAAELARHGFNLVRLGQVGVDLLGELATTVACWRLSVQDLAGGIEAVRTARRDS